MLPLSEIRSFYPDELHRFPRFLLREYLQHKILEIVFNSPHAGSLCFMGGTCLRIIHNSRRFSEDLDFDNRGLNPDQFDEIVETVRRELSHEGYSVELKSVKRGAWHCYIRFPGLLFREGLSGHQEEKILIQLDTEPQEYDYEPEEIILNKFEVFTTVLTTPLSILFAQKLFAILNRSRKQGRDFFDVVFLMSKEVQPDYSYVEQKADIPDHDSLREKILSTCETLDMEKLAQDVEPFLFNPMDRARVVKFPEYFRQSF